MKTSKFNRILSALLAIILFLGCVPVFPVLAQEKETFRVTLDGEDLTTLGLYPYEKLKIQAAGLENGENYQWQILHPERENVWVNIYDAKTDSLNVTLALVKNMLTEAGTTQLRCRANAEGQQQFTTPITVTMLEEQPALIAEPEETIPMEATVPTEPVVEETSAPTEPIETTVPTEPVETAPVETTVSTEPVETVPVETTVATEPMETVPVETTVSTEPVETTPVETTVATEPLETTPVETTVSTEPVETVPVETTVATEPVETVPVETTVVTEPMETTSVEATDPAETFAAQVSETVEPAPMLFAAFSARNAALPLAEGDAETEETTAPAETPEFVTVTIEYRRYDFQRDDENKLVVDANGNPVLEDGNNYSPAFNSYVATLQYGTNLKTTVKNPTLIGYQPWYVNPDTNQKETSTEIEINLENITENKTYVVLYEPALVDYTVTYHFQNIYDDDYQEDASQKQIYQGYTGAMPPDSSVKKSFEGFASLYYQPETIAADGSTVFAAYYEREYYLMEFDCDGGYGVEPLYIRYGTYISVPTPKKMGYNFGGWDLIESDNPDFAYVAGKDDLPTEMPAYNSKYKVIWTNDSTYYTVVYWLENANDEQYSYWGSEEIRTNADGTALLSGSKISAAMHYDAPTNLPDYQHVTYNATKTLQEERGNPDYDSTTQKVIVQGDGSTVVNIYFDRKEYTLKFYYAMSNLTDGYNYVIGGSTYRFGASATINNKSNDVDLLSYYMNSYTSERGWIKDVPTLKNSVDSSKFIQNAEELTITEGGASKQYKYHYIAFNAKYGQDISDKWPCNVFNPAERSNPDNSQGTKWSGKYAFVSAWNGEYNVYYSKHNGNQTIKGNYEKLDENLLWEPTYDNNYQYADTTHNDIDGDGTNDDTAGTVAFLCFWENGTVNKWNIPELYRYNIYLETLAGQTYTTTVTKADSKQYYLDTSYDTCDNSWINEQTQPSLTGFTAKTYYYPNNTENLEYAKVSDGVYFEYKQLSKGVDYSGDLYNEGYDVNFYYTRNENILEFYNYNAVMSDKGDSNVKYGTPLSSYRIQDAEMGSLYYPSGLEPNAYEFKGWYTTPSCFPGTEVDWDTLTMPDSKLTLYANWQPVTHNVRFFLHYSDIAANNNTTNDKCWQPDPDKPITYPISAPHGSLLESSYSDHPTREETDSSGNPVYTFIGWFYMDKEGKKRFAPDSMEITKDLDLFADWKSSKDTTYTVTYVIKGGTTEIADPTTGHITAGVTKTFDAKGGTALYEAYREGYFPTTNSHSILMDTDSGLNNYKFEYVKDDVVYYKVRYVDALTKKTLGETDPIPSNKAIVTEKFKPFAGYVPKKYYIRKTLKTDGNAEADSEVLEDNIIIFEYDPDTEHGAYVVEHYQENVDSTDPDNINNYTRIHYITGVADLDSSIYGELLVPEGFSHVPEFNTRITYTDKGDVEKTERENEDGDVADFTDNSGQPYGNVSQNGLTLQVYYKRNLYNYVVEYRDRDTDTILQTATSGTQNFGTELTWSLVTTDENGIVTRDDRIIQVIKQESDGTERTYTYTLAILNPKESDLTKSTIIHVSSEENPNKLIFYYTQKEVEVQYKAVCSIPDITNFASVSPNKERVTSAENIGGCTPTAANGFEFVGWYTDEACTNKVPSGWVIDKNNDGKSTHLKPLELNTTENSVTYYALFKPILTSLAITKEVAKTDKNGAAFTEKSTDSFLFRITGKANTSTKDVDMIVAINGSGSVIVENLNCGEYTVTELTDWSWKYDCSATAVTKKIVALTEGGDFPEDNTFTFNNTYNNPDWLGGESGRENKFS